MKYLFILIIQLFLLQGSDLFGQTSDRELIVRWKSEKEAAKAAPDHLTARKWLSRSTNTELLRFGSQESMERAEERLKGEAGLWSVERNQAVEFRVDPNDPRYNEQRTNFERAGFTAAWDLTAGGRTTNGKQIVVAVLDAGFDYNHEDIRANLWNNQMEIPGDGIDNDNNGYVDDIFGWDMTNGDARPPVNGHGTQVIGLIGAKGDNGVGISGSNWDVQLMLFSISSSSDVVEAYEYITEQRKRYNESDGEEGAFVVATNASFGIEGGTCADNSAWGNMYEAMGQVGILTAASTANRHWDVDMFGDMPTDCPTDYLIGVANVGENDALYRSSGFGRESIDLAAPGEGSFSTNADDAYSSFGSTSAAAPYVTGAIALLYATPCPSLLDQVETDPAGAALLVRDAILGATDANNTLTTRTATGGTLNVAAAQLLLAENCNAGSQEDFKITSVYPNPAVTNVTIETNALVFSDGAVVELFDALGRRVRVMKAVRTGTNPIRLDVNVAGLAAGAYLVRVTERSRVAEERVIVR